MKKKPPCIDLTVFVHLLGKETNYLQTSGSWKMPWIHLLPPCYILARSQDGARELWSKWESTSQPWICPSGCLRNSEVIWGCRACWCFNANSHRQISPRTESGPKELSAHSWVWTPLVFTTVHSLNRADGEYKVWTDARNSWKFQELRPSIWENRLVVASCSAHGLGVLSIP